MDIRVSNKINDSLQSLQESGVNTLTSSQVRAGGCGGYFNKGEKTVTKEESYRVSIEVNAQYLIVESPEEIALDIRNLAIDYGIDPAVVEMDLMRAGRERVQYLTDLRGRR